MSRRSHNGLMSKSTARKCDILQAEIHLTVDEQRRNGDLSPTFRLPTFRIPRSGGKYYDPNRHETPSRHDRVPTQVPRRERYTPSSQTQESSSSQETWQYDTRDDFTSSYPYPPTPPTSRSDRRDLRRHEAETHFQDSAASPGYDKTFPQYYQEPPSFAHSPGYTAMPPPGQDMILYQDPACGRAPSVASDDATVVIELDRPEEPAPHAAHPDSRSHHRSSRRSQHRESRRYEDDGPSDMPHHSSRERRSYKYGGNDRYRDRDFYSNQYAPPQPEQYWAPAGMDKDTRKERGHSRR